ncbi:MAG: CoA transferase subunit A [Gaiellales bacterium]|nr:CoA transferase subunit A [Gaiellales bacterium]
MDNADIGSQPGAAACGRRDGVCHKLLTSRQAVERYVKPGCTLAVGGFTINRNPMALVHEIVRQRISDLHLVAHSNGQALDVLVGGGCVSCVEVAYAGNGRFAPSCIRFRRAVERGELAVEDYSNYQMSLRFLAGALNVPFVPTKSGLGTDLVAKQGFSAELRRRRRLPRQKVIVSSDPFHHGANDVVLLPALNPDVTLIHAQYVGDDGTVRIKGLTFADLEEVKAASAVVVSCEQIVPRRWLRQDPDQNSLPGFMVDAYVLAPWGAHPTACHYFYDYDPAHLKYYAQAAKDEERWAAYLAEWVYGLDGHEAYVDKVGGTALMRIAADRARGFAPGLDRR